MPEKSDRNAASFRDPSGFVFSREGTIYRQINRSYEEEYALLMSSGLYDKLTQKGWLVPHTEVGLEYTATGDACQVVCRRDDSIPRGRCPLGGIRSEKSTRDHPFMESINVNHELSTLVVASDRKTAAATTVVHKPFLSPSAVCTHARVRTILPDML